MGFECEVCGKVFDEEDAAEAHEAACEVTEEKISAFHGLNKPPKKDKPSPPIANHTVRVKGCVGETEELQRLAQIDHAPAVNPEVAVDAAEAVMHTQVDTHRDTAYGAAQSKPVKKKKKHKGFGAFVEQESLQNTTGALSEAANNCPPSAGNMDTPGPAPSEVFICGTRDRPGTPGEVAAAQAMTEAMMPAMQRAAEIAAMELVQRSRGDATTHAAVEQYKLSPAAVRKIADDLREVVTKLVRVGIDSGATLPYQELLSNELKQSIDSGELDLIGYCNSSHGELMVPDAYIDEGTVGSCQIAINGFLPLQLRKLKARITNTTIFEVRGEDARYMGLDTLWDAISPRKRGSRTSETMSRFSLPTAIMALRLSATKYIPTLDDYFYYDHPSNCLMTTTEGSTNKSGVAFIALKKLSEVFNAMIYRHHGSPEEETENWELANAQFFQPDTVKAVIAALSRITQVDSDKATQQARLFFTVAPTPQWRSNLDLVTLIQPICSIESEAMLAERHVLYDRLLSGALTRGVDQADLPIFSDPSHAPPRAQVPNMINEPTLRVLGHPSSFKWEKPGDARPSPPDPRGTADDRWRVSSGGRNKPTTGKGGRAGDSNKWRDTGHNVSRSRDTSHTWRMTR